MTAVEKARIQKPSHKLAVQYRDSHGRSVVLRTWMRFLFTWTQQQVETVVRIVNK